MNEHSNITDDDRLATMKDYRDAEFEPYPESLLTLIGTNDEFGRRHLSMVRLALVILTKDKSKLANICEEGGDAFMMAHEQIGACRRHLTDLAEICQIAEIRLISAAASSLTEEEAYQ